MSNKIEQEHLKTRYAKVFYRRSDCEHQSRYIHKYYLPQQLRKIIFPVDTGSLKLTVAAAAVVPVGTTLSTPMPTLEVGLIVKTQLAVSGGTAPYTYTGTLPAGIGLTSTGALIGAPLLAGTTNGNITVKDAAGKTTVFPMTFNVAVAPKITTDGMAAGKIGTEYNLQFAATGGVGTLKWTTTTPIDGMTFCSTGLLSGKPTVVTTYKFSVKVADANGVESNKAFMIAVSK